MWNYIEYSKLVQYTCAIIQANKRGGKGIVGQLTMQLNHAVNNQLNNFAQQLGYYLCLKHISSGFLLCVQKCSRKNTAGSPQVSATEVELLLVELMLWGTEGTEGERDSENNIKAMALISFSLTGFIYTPLRRVQQNYIYCTLTISSVYTELSTERSKSHSEGSHWKIVLGTRD